MKKSLLIGLFSLSVLSILVCVYGWFTGQLYFRVIGAKIEYNGSPSAGSKYYKSGGNLAIVVLEEPGSRNVNYAISNGPDGLSIAEFLSESPDDNMLQYHNAVFATCVSPQTYAGMDDGYGGHERIHQLDNGFEFNWGKDHVRVTI